MFIIREAALSDVPAMHEIRTAVQENRLSQSSAVTEASYLAYVSAGTAWVAEAGDAILGFAILDIEANSVWALFVDRHSQAVGIGRALHDRMLECARENGLRSLRLSTSPGTRAEQFYKAAGSRQAGFNAQGEALFERFIVPDASPGAC